MGNKLSCSCAPLIKKTGYRYEDSPWNPARRRDGHLLRLWAEVFHVSSSGSGTVKWQQVSEDLVPVNITCIQDTPECVFHITAYNSQVDKILDVRLIQPGTRIGQASECFVYWKDPATSDTWGLNFTSPIDAKQFRECCSPSFKFSRKASSSYSLKLEPVRGGGGKTKGRRKPVSTPASPSRTREPQCTCMTAEQYARLRAQDPRYREDSGQVENSIFCKCKHNSRETVEKEMNGNGNKTENGIIEQQGYDQVRRQQQVTLRAASHSPPELYDNLHLEKSASTLPRTQGGRGVVEGPASRTANHGAAHTTATSTNTTQAAMCDTMASRRGGDGYATMKLGNNRDPRQPPSHHASHASLHHKSGTGVGTLSRKEEASAAAAAAASVSAANERSGETPTSGSRDNRSLRGSRRELSSKSVDYSEMDTVRETDTLRRRARSKSTDDVTKGNSDFENNEAAPSSPTSQLLQEYEMHLRNTLAKGMDAESYSLHTFEALLTQSMENLGNLNNKYGTMPASTRGSERSLPAAAIRDEREHSGYFSDRNDSYGSRRDLYDRGYMSDHERRFYDRQDSIRSGYMSDRERGYTSDRDSRGYMSDRDRSGYMSDGERGYMSDRERGYMSDRERGYVSDRERGGYTSNRELGGYVSDRERGYMSDRERGYMSDRERGYMNNRERGYMSDRDTRGYTSDRERGYASDRGGYGSDRERGYSSDREHSALVAQASMESADSRLCYLTSSEMSDDDRMSLTTAVSEDEDGESVHNSPYKAPRAGTTAASFNCTGAVRKAGFLSVKKWLLRKKHQIELARKRGWKGYWVCLKGTTLLFYPCDSREGRSVEAAPKHLIIVDGAIMQPIPEHPKRDYIFCLSTAFGDAYLFQAPCQVELENWVNSIHSACAAAFARHRGKTGTLHLLQEEIFRIDRAIESDSKLKHMAELQLSVVSDAESKQQIMGQIMQWEENLERLHCEQFRLRCYMASLQTGELPNPKGLLTHVSRTTKTVLNRLGVFTVSSFHAYICARSPSLLNNLLAGRGATKRRAPMLSRSNSVSSRRSLQMQQQLEGEKQYKVNLPDNQIVSISLKDSMSVEEFLVAACGRKNLNPMEHFVRVKKRRELEETNYFVPHRTDLIENYLATHEVVEICGKILYQVELSRSSLDHMWGFSVEAELIENSERQDELCCYISRVEDRSTAMQNGIIKGDEIMVINGAIVSDLDMMYIESVLQEELALCLMMRSSRTEPPDLASLMKTTDEIIESLVCPPPPSEMSLNEEMISRMIVPAPSWSKSIVSGKEPASPDGFPPPPSDTSERSNVSSLEIESYLKSSDLSGCCRSPVERRSSPTGSITSTQSQSQLTPSRQLSDGERLKKVILELVDTEKTYVKHLNNLLENYLEPLKSASFLSSAEVNALFGNIREIVAFQRLFLQALQEALDMEPGFLSFDQPYEFKNVLFSIGSAFLYYASQFKLYSSFCASHSKAQKVLHPSEGNQELKEFLSSRNPRQQHSATLESYLIKPIQRILKYPLLLQQLKALTTPGADEHRHLVEALKVMEKVAEHINEMQRIHEEYGAIFDHLFRQHQKSCKQEPRISRDPHLPQPVDLSPGDLLYYGGVEWLNISDFLGKIKKGLELHAMCFVFKTAVVFLCKERLRQKKKLMVSGVGAPGKNSSSEVEIIRYQVLIPVTEVQVRASSMKDMDSHFLWELIHLKSQLQRRSEKVYHLSNSTSEFRNAFLKTIRQIIRESVRNMNIPANKPSSSSSSLSSKGNTNTLQPSRSAPKKKTPIVQSATLQRHSAGNIDYDNLESYDNVPETQVGHDQNNFRTRSKTVSDGMDELSDSTTKSDGGKDEVGTRSEGEEEVIDKKKATLGRTPNHLSLSTTSTLSTGSTGSMAKLIQASNQPAQYQPTRSVGSPVWKPRDVFASSGGSSGGGGGAGQRGESLTLPRPGKASGREDHFLVYEEYGGNIYMSSKKDTENGIMERGESSVSVRNTIGVPIPTKNGGFRFGPTIYQFPAPHLNIYTNGHLRETIHHARHVAVRPASVNGSPSHLPPRGAVPCWVRREAYRSGVKRCPWPGFPYTENKASQTGEDIDNVLGAGMTIDSLLQQLRALS
ncbi:protein still life, isoform SIF type 1 isoform X17 [Cherax quadricarinatus]|uniref:protein still life, isoform SIF type 1 isoform X17 n=1 Tax=Cherax quadricarinatus TaxID=27406 RepID=UPI00387ED4EE